MIKLFLTLIVAALAVSAHAQETVGGLVCGQTYDYDYIISVLGEPDYVSHDMYEFLVYKEKRLSAEAEALPVGPPTGTAQEAPKEDSFKVRKFPGTVWGVEYEEGNGELHWSDKQIDPDNVLWAMYPYFCYDKDGVITSIEYYYD